MKRVIRLNEMPTGKKIQFRDDNRDVWYKFCSRIRNKNFGLCKSDQRQLGMMYAEAFDKDREDLADRIYGYACKKQREYGRMKSNGDDELCERLDMEMMDAFSQGQREYDNSDIWTDDDPNFNGPGGYEDSIYQFENKKHNSINNIIRLTESDLHSIIKNSVIKILSENSNPHPRAGYCEMYRKPQDIEQDKANFPKYFEQLMNNGEVMVGCADKSFDLWLIQNHPEVEYDLRPCADYYERTKYYLK